MTRTPAAALQHLLRERHWTQAELAAWAGVTQGAVSRWLSGTRTPRHRKIRRWLIGRGVDPLHL